MLDAAQKKRKISDLDIKQLILLLTIITLGFFLLLFLLYIISPKALNTILPFAMVIVTVTLIAQFLLLIRFFNGIKLINQNANQLSQGNLNINDILASRTQGLETLTIAFNDMKRDLTSFIENTKSNVIVLSDTVDKVTKSIDMSLQGNEQIASSMSTASEKSQEQLSIVKSTLDNISEMKEQVVSITTSLEKIENFVEDTTSKTADGTEHLDKYMEQMDVISADLGDATDFISTLNDDLQQINQVGQLIITITEQLKLLSLNSAVEAARAGEAGRGFVVVADEMNKLSTQTRDSIGQINDFIKNITSSNEKVSVSISSVSNSFNLSKDIFQSVKESFETINKNANILNGDMKMVYSEAKDISDRTNTIYDQGGILHDASNEISSITQDVAAVTQEQLAETEEINTQIHSLTSMLSGIEALIKRYKTSIAPVDNKANKPHRIVMMSPLDHPFWHSVRKGALYAENELKSLNTTVEYIGFDKNENNEFVSTLAEKIKEGCDGLILPGVVPGIEEKIAYANQKNIPVIAFNNDFSNNVKRLSYFGPDVKEGARIAGELLATAMAGEGQYAFLSGDISNPINHLRRDTIMSIMKKHKDVTLATEIELSTDDDYVHKNIKDILQKFYQLKIIVIISGGASAAAKAIRQMDRVGTTKIICFDYDDEVIELIRQGIVYAALGQDPFGQGHDPVIYLYNYLAAGEVPEDVIHTRTEIMNSNNID